jgi:phosphoadenosine phosphosulfate reductase
MIEKNRNILESLTQETIKKIYNTYLAYQKKIDIFYVAFSGGKDSVVTLDLVQRALPHNAFKVLFGDTKMEFPDTYRVVDEIRSFCNIQNIDFLTSQSHFNPKDSWRLFGPPAQTIRWCCSVHKTSPQIILLRELLQKSNFTGMAFIGVRASESLARSEYDYVSLGEKHKGQYSCNPILEWNSAELFLYVYANDLILNECYKKGNNRAGCLVCPNVSEKNAYFRKVCYEKEVNDYITIISDLYRDSMGSSAKLEEFLNNTGWKARMNGRDISLKSNYSEIVSTKKTEIKIVDPRSNWKEWIKTIGVLQTYTSPYQILFRGKTISFAVKEENNELYIDIDGTICKKEPIFTKLLKNVFRKAAECVGCRECEADCHNGCLKIIDGKVNISDNCKHCAECHKVDNGCLIYKSLAMPKGGMGMSQKSLNCYSTHAPKMDWIAQYFKYKDEFDSNNDLGSQMFSFFKRFLRDADLLDNKGFSRTARIIERCGLDDLSAWGIMLANLAYTPQIGWFIKNFEFRENVSRNYAISRLMDDGTQERAANDIWRSYSRFIDLPFSEIGLGVPDKDNGKTVSFTRISWLNPEPKVILYALYKFSEACGNYKQFSLTRLLNHEIESDGISPTQIFGLDRTTMERILNGLSNNYPDFISVSFTLDLDNINLKDKTSDDVLSLFEGV